jgi:malate/lactate dehydrogenase
MKIGIIGCGFVGSSGAFAIALAGAATDLILVDLKCPNWSLTIVLRVNRVEFHVSPSG